MRLVSLLDLSDLSEIRERNQPTGSSGKDENDQIFEPFLGLFQEHHKRDEDQKQIMVSVYESTINIPSSVLISPWRQNRGKLKGNYWL
jgi:hypothetical protein